MGKWKGEVTEIVPVKSGSQNPIMIEFQNTQPKNKEIDEMKFNLAVDKNTKQKSVVLGSESTVYCGTIGSESENTNHMNTFIGIRNKITNKVRLIEVEQCTVLHAAYKNESCLAVDDSNKIFFTKLGNKQRARKFERNETGQANVSLIANQMNKSIHDFDDSVFNLDMLNDSVNTDTSESILPPKNPHLIKINEVYTMNNIIDKELLDHLEEVARTILSTANIAQLFASSYILERVQLIKSTPTPDSPENLMKMKQLIYMDALCRLLNVKRLSLKRVELSKISEKVEENIRNNFAQIAHGRMMNTAYTQKKCVCYLLILAFLESENNEIDFAKFTEGLYISIATMGEYAMFIGAKSKSKNIYSCKTVSERRKTVNAFSKRGRKKM